MVILYLVVMVAATTKYSVNSLFRQPRMLFFQATKIAQNSLMAAHPSWINALIQCSISGENRPRHVRFSCRRNIEDH